MPGCHGNFFFSQTKVSVENITPNDFIIITKIKLNKPLPHNYSSLYFAL